MEFTVQYLQDDKGKNTAVQVPIKEWNKLQKKLDYLEQYIKVKLDLKEAMQEVKDLRSGKRRKKSLDEVLDEL